MVTDERIAARRFHHREMAVQDVRRFNGTFQALHDGLALARRQQPAAGSDAGRPLAGRHLLEGIGHPWLRINYDPGNVVYYAGVRPEEDIVHARGLIGHVHLKDKRGGKGILDFPPLGEGELDIPVMLGELRDSGFSGPVSMEIEFTDYQYPGWSECVEAARRGKAYWDSLQV